MQLRRIVQPCSTDFRVFRACKQFNQSNITPIQYRSHFETFGVGAFRAREGNCFIGRELVVLSAGDDEGSIGGLPLPFPFDELTVEAGAETLVAEDAGVGWFIELSVADDRADEATYPDPDCTDELSVACLRGRRLGPGVDGPTAALGTPYVCGSLSARSFAIFCAWFSGVCFRFRSFSS
jgi:hypothetical protein